MIRVFSNLHMKLRHLVLEIFRELRGMTLKKKLVLLAIPYLCLGAMVLANAQTDRNPMKFSLHHECTDGNFCGSFILAQGIFTPTTPSDFEKFIVTINFTPPIYFDSPGGNLVAGLQLGQHIRKRGIDTHVGGPYESQSHNNTPVKTIVPSAICFSACAYAFLGGVNRHVGLQGKYGVHQFRSTTTDGGEAAAQLTVAVLGAYIDNMGVDRKLLDLASTTASGKIQLVSKHDAQSLGVDNQIDKKSIWKIHAGKNGDLIVFSRQRQSARDAITSLIITKTRGKYFLTLEYKTNQKFRNERDVQDAFTEFSKFSIGIPGVKFSLIPLDSGKYNFGSFIGHFSIPDDAIALLKEVNSFELTADWPNYLRDIDPSTSFGTEGLNNALGALAKN
jgi:hypothetical protein